ncbi:two-component sensor histidine kinase [Desulfosarcina ovata subsp. sediminis]|uniref:histidine kinase n=1 Tax=Desulfosarcina ovata subsp. sediminis TaxID=885957 RepID=A0A5K7ZV03_9BACT|nr:ATP-binding protein [Desulfosarcina ovata]BBO84072.1 two-component sensor histidine kinase [Desulfosarcina ovata subsp. sediminis]
MKNDDPHFRTLWYRVLAALLGAAFIPLVTIGGIFSIYAVSIFKTRTLEMLVRDATLRQWHLDRFLQDRILELGWVARVPSAILTDQERFDAYARDLIRERPWMNDLAIFDLDGNQLAYTGHYARQTGNYSGREWFRKARDAGSCISDMELGNRQLPHISIAVRGQGRLQDLIIRASVDSKQIHRQMNPEQKAFFSANVFLVNQNGRYQIPPPSGGQIMGPSDIGAQDRFDGIQTRTDGDTILMTTWLQAAPWILAVHYEKDAVYAPAVEMRLLSLWALLIGGFLIVCFVLLTADALVSRLEATRQRIGHLNRQLRRSSFMTSAMELGTGLLREIIDRLSSITVAAQWLETHLADNLTPPVNEDIRQISESATVGRERLNQFLSIFDQQTSMITAVNLESVVKTLLTWLQQELTLRCIRVEWEVENDLPEIRSDEVKLRHAIQNLLINAIHAVNQHGVIQITLSRENKGVAMTIADNGPGIPEAEREKIFEPLYTTKSDGTGLGLPVARDVIQALGGSLILLQTTSAGTAFRLFLPCDLGASPVVAGATDANAET